MPQSAKLLLETTEFPLTVEYKGNVSISNLLASNFEYFVNGEFNIDTTSILEGAKRCPDRYDAMYESITDQNFRQTFPGSHLYKFGKDFVTVRICAIENGFLGLPGINTRVRKFRKMRHANAAELLAFTTSHPDQICKDKGLIALGQIFKDDLANGTINHYALEVRNGVNKPLKVQLRRIACQSKDTEHTLFGHGRRFLLAIE